jgi:hypothetical protein
MALPSRLPNWKVRVWVNEQESIADGIWADRPFSEQTRRHFLPLLSSRTWWEETTYELRKLFAVDPDFHPKMFARQMAVIKGQAWNVLQSLKHPDEGKPANTPATCMLNPLLFA